MISVKLRFILQFNGSTYYYKQLPRKKEHFISFLLIYSHALSLSVWGSSSSFLTEGHIKRLFSVVPVNKYSW